MNPKIIESLSTNEKGEILKGIINFYNSIKDKNKIFDDSHHEVADAIFRIFDGEKGTIEGYKKDF